MFTASPSQSTSQAATAQSASVPLIPDVNCEKVIGHRHRFIFVGVPKSATRSFLTLFVRQPPVEFDAVESKLPLAMLAADPELKDYFRFSFVRNPWARAVSAWLNKVAHPRQKEIEGVIAKCPGLRPGMPFEEFVRWLEESPYGRDEGANRHWQSQYRFLLLPNGQRGVHWVGRMEEIEAGFKEVSEQIGLPVLELPRKNVSAAGRNGQATQNLHYYREHFDETTRDIIARRYKRDIEMFGYTF